MTSLLHFLQYNYAPAHQPWYSGADWPNAFILLVLGPLGFLWSRTKYWPLNLIHGKLDRILAHHREQKEHNEWVARHMAAMHQEVTGREADPHPHFGVVATK